METTNQSNRSFFEIVERIFKSFGGRLLVGLVFAAGIWFFFGWLAEDVFKGVTKIFDESVRNFIHGFAAPPLTAAMKFFTYFGSPLSLTILGVIVIAAFFYLKHKRAVALFSITMAGEVALNLAFKMFFKRVRPEPFFDFPLPASYGFPSGHAFGSFCFFGILAWLTSTRTQNKITKAAIWSAAVIIILFVGLSRVYLGVHYPSDVLAGYAAGLFWIVIVALTDSRLRRNSAVD